MQIFKIQVKFVNVMFAYLLQKSVIICRNCSGSAGTDRVRDRARPQHGQVPAPPQAHAGAQRAPKREHDTRVSTRGEAEGSTCA